MSASRPSRILVVNSGSSSLKLRVVEDDARVVDRADLAALGSGDDAPAGGAAALADALEALAPVDAVGHRVVHGGLRYRAPVRIDDDVVRQLGELAVLAPLHQPGSMAGIEAARRALPGVPHVACFDTAFHATLPDPAATYALPAAWRGRWPELRRFGFHGLSHAWAARRAAELLQRPPDGLRLVTAHLGAGASLAAIASGRSVDTTMGLTPLEGLVMATRAGSIDPGLVLWLQREGGLTPSEVEHGLEHDAGILGLGGTADMRELIATADAGAVAAVLAREVYLHRLRAGIAAMAAAMGGLDALVFTGGVGEHAPGIRARAVGGLGFLGLALDQGRNEDGAEDREIGLAGAAAASLVVASREELEIARQVRELLGG